MNTLPNRLPKLRAPARTQPSANLPRMLSKQQAADLLSLSLKTLTRKIQSGQLRSHRFGRSVRISEEDLAAFTAARRR